MGEPAVLTMPAVPMVPVEEAYGRGGLSGGVSEEASGRPAGPTLGQRHGVSYTHVLNDALQRHRRAISSVDLVEHSHLQSQVVEIGVLQRAQAELRQERRADMQRLVVGGRVSQAQVETGEKGREPAKK